jgi:hypothetical protein
MIPMVVNVANQVSARLGYRPAARLGHANSQMDDVAA